MTTADLRLTPFEPLRQQLLAAAEAFAGAKPLARLLGDVVDDVGRATAEPLEIFPVCHHSPSAAVHMIRRLKDRPPRVIFMEMCEDMRPLLDKLRDCKLPVALQAFAGQTDTFPKSWAPLSVVAPITEFSAEFQAIAYTLDHPETELIFVDRSVDHIFQWMPQQEGELEKHLGPDSEPDDAIDPADKPPTHGAALGVQMGDIEPTLERFNEFLIQNAQVRSFAEWWDQYVEQTVLPADSATYRQVFFLVGSLLRRLGRKDADHESDRLRERFMWTRMKEHLAQRRLPPEDAIYICGAIHAVSDVEEFGTRSLARWDIPERTKTAWLYGIIPSSHTAIDSQFHFPPGTVTLSEASWDKGLRALDLKPFSLGKAGGKPKKVVPSVPAAPKDITDAGLMAYLTRPPRFLGEDEEQLLAWCVGIVEKARENGYLATTADGIAIYQTSILLAGLRNRRHPTPYDFRDAAITCLEKDRTPKKRDIRRLCKILLGGDRRGQVGVTALPPLAQDVYERLNILTTLDKRFSLQSGSIQRALMDLRARPDLRPASDLLWKLRYLLSGYRVVRPIMGERTLGSVASQESWDIEIGKNQTPLIQLGYEGITVEHVLERRLKTKAFGAGATPVTALEAAEECILYLGSARLTEEIGLQAVALLVQETGAQSAPEVFERMRRLVHFFRSTPDGLPGWARHFVTTGYAHYTTLLPAGFADRGTTPEQVAAMLAFIFNLEGLALSLGCDRSQLLIAVRQAGGTTDDPNKLGLLWAAEWVLGLRGVDEIRLFFDRLFDNALALASFPAYINGFLLALKFTTLVIRLVVELMSRAFERLPDAVLLPWMPGLILSLRPHVGDVLPGLLRDAAATFPTTLAELHDWQPPWQVAKPVAFVATAGTGVDRSEDEEAIHDLLAAHPASIDALAAWLSVEGTWEVMGQGRGVGAATTPALSGAEAEVQALLAEHLAGAAALGQWLGVG